MTHPHLQKNYKRMFPFKLGTTSYIYPDEIVPNVAKLAPFLDEIELVLFESEGLDNYPDETQMKDLMSLSIHQGVDFNIHLPIDIFLGDEEEEIRVKGVNIAKKVMERTLCLRPSLYTLHLDLRNKEGREETDIKTWRRRIGQSIKEIRECGVEPSRISIETLGYPFEWIEDVVEASGFSICLDIGHILITGQDLRLYFDKYLPKASILHLHGFQDKSDHLAIDRLPEPALKLIVSHLRDYHGIVSLEVFSLDDLKRSLFVLEEKWRVE